MKRFTRLFSEIDETNRTAEKVAALEEYFRAAPPEDAAWALYFLTGRKLKRLIKTGLLREWVAERSGQPLWLLEECYDAAGDLAETLALLLPENRDGTERPLHAFVDAYLLPLQDRDDTGKRVLLEAAWSELNAKQCFVWHKIITGQFRVGVARTLVVRALAQAAGVDPAVMTHRLMGQWEPTADDYNNLLSGELSASDPGRPYPFFLAYPLEENPDTLGEVSDWQIEWKWDGIRAQLLRRSGETMIWSRGEELVTATFPEVADAGDGLPDGTVLDGELVAWKDGVLPFNQLQRRLGRKQVGPKLREEVPVAFLAYDILERDGEDIRTTPQSERRRILEGLLESLSSKCPLLLSPLVEADSWEDLARLREESRDRRVEGFMLKRARAAYGVGRTRGEWWKWKVDPYTVDAVLIYAQKGHGRRANLFTDYTFGVWDAGELVPIAKAYSGLSDEEIRQVDRWVRQHTTERFGPVRVVQPELVFELAFEAIQPSRRHKSGLAVRFPRMARWRHDKKAAEADSLQTVRALADQGSAGVLPDAGFEDSAT